MNNKKLLILGSDYGTLQVVKEAHALGLYVIVADLMESSPTKSEADEAWLISTTDIDGLTEACIEHKIDAIMFGASDFNIGNAREICKRLDLPIYCENDYAWRVARDKGEFKRLCNEVGAPVALGYSISDSLSDDELDAIVYPVVVKPVDKSGNRGMSYCNNREELIKAYRYARSLTNNEIIVERRLNGAEYNAHYVLANGEAHLLYLSSAHHQPGYSENIYSLKCTTSNHLNQFIEEVNEKLVDVFKKAGCKDGIVWVDCMRDMDGHFYLLEMGYRFGGVMTYVPYEKVYGFNTVKWMLECSLGIKHTASDMPPALSGTQTECAASYHLFTTKDATISKISGIDLIRTLPNVYIDMPKREGNAVRANACMGLIGIYGSDINEICSTLALINSNLSIVDEKGDNLFIYYDDYASLISEYNDAQLNYR